MKKNLMIELPLNPWPIKLTLNLANMISNTVLMNNIWTLSTSMFFITLINWNKSLNKENFKSKKSIFLYSINKIMIIMMIMMEMMFFTSMFYMYLTNKIFPPIMMNLSWKYWMNYPISLLNSMILLTSSMTVTSSIKHQMINNLSISMIKLNKTKILSMLFLMIQAYELFNNKFMINNSFYWSTFITLTSFHAMHVLMGTINFSLNNSKLMSLINIHKLIMTAWYWHFVDSVWLTIFIIMY